MKHLREFEEWNPDEWDEAGLDAETSGMNTMGFGFQGIMEIAIEAPEHVVNMNGGELGNPGDCWFILSAIYDSIESPAADEIVAAIARVSPRLNPLNLLGDDEPEIEVSREEMVRMKAGIWEVLERRGKRSPFELHASLFAIEDYPGPIRQYAHSFSRLGKTQTFRDVFGDITEWELETNREGEIRKTPRHVFDLEQKENEMIKSEHQTSTLRIYRGEGAEESIAYVYAER